MIKIPKYERIIVLGREKAVDAIKDADTVMYRHGVWNEYYKTTTENAIKSIENSGYGADVCCVLLAMMVGMCATTTRIRIRADSAILSLAFDGLESWEE